MRAVCGRLKSDYRYSKDIVYNNFPWPSPTPEQQAKIGQGAQAILAARALYPDSSLADLYDPTLMPKELLLAHRQNDRAVMAAYGFSTKMTESECAWRSYSRCMARWWGRNAARYLVMLIKIQRKSLVVRRLNNIFANITF